MPGGAAPAPCSQEAEEHVLGACFLDEGAALGRCIREKITADAFYFPNNAKLFQLLLELAQADRPIALEVVAEELRSRGELEQIGGFPFLMQIGRVPTTAHFGFFIEKVREKWVLRKLRHYGLELVEQIDEFHSGLDDLVSKHALRVQRVADFVTRLNHPGQAEEAAAASAAASEILAGKIDTTRRLTFGLPFADQTFLPMDVRNEDWLVIVGAGPSGGKSSVMRFSTAANCRRKKRGAVFLLETGKRRWLWSLAAGMAKVELREMMENPARALPGSIEAWKKANDEVTGWVGERLFVFDDLFFIEDIERSVREIDRTLREQDLAEGVDPASARGLDFVVIDYLQLMNTREKIRVREEMVSYLTRSCKRLFKSLDVSGMVAAQINRKAREEGRRPKLSDLRESGAIEQDADRVVFVHTPPNDRNGIAQTGDRAIDEVELVQAKSRNGPRDVAIDVLFFKRQARYEDAPRKGDPRPGEPKPAGGYKREGQS